MFISFGIILFVVVWFSEALKREVCTFANSTGKSLLASHLHNELKNQIYQTDEDFLNITRDSNNRVTSLHVHAKAINRFAAELADKLYNKITSYDSPDYGIPLGNLSGFVLFSDKGPIIRVKPVLLGNVASEIKSELIDAGINQTLHRITLSYSVAIQYLSPIHSTSNTITLSVILSETLIVGEVPIYRD